MENWRKIKNASNIYFEAAHVLFENFDNGMKNNIEIEKSLIIPQVVLQIFSCELSLKALLLRENIVYTNTHDLKSLFNKLPIQYKNNIKISVVNDMRLKFKETCDFENELENISNMFIKLQYYFEDENNKEITVGFIDAFSSTLKREVGDYE